VAIRAVTAKFSDFFGQYKKLAEEIGFFRSFRDTCQDKTKRAAGWIFGVQRWSPKRCDEWMSRKSEDDGSDFFSCIK
jgi:hypothetical protein